MRPYRTVAVAAVEGGGELVLARREREWCVRVDGKILMSSLQHDSEESLAREALARVARPQQVLVGGLGLGFTLRAVLDGLPHDGRVTVSELVPELVAWNREHLAELHGAALDDPRCEVVVGDVLALIGRSRARFDVIALDVDNGPVALSRRDNHALYSKRGIGQCHAALQSGGVLAVWSAGPSARYEAALAEIGFQVERVSVAARRGKGSRHVLFLGKRR